MVQQSHRPDININRTIADYLFSIDPLLQGDNAYFWGQKRPESIFDNSGSGQYKVDSNNNPIGPFVNNSQVYIRTARFPSTKLPIWLTGPCYDIYGKGINLKPSSGHSVFQDNTPVIDDSNKTQQVVAPLDIRYDPLRHVFTTPHSMYPVIIMDVAASGTAYDPYGKKHTSIGKIPGIYDGGEKIPFNVYNIASGLYRYKVKPYFTIDSDFQPNDLKNYPSGVMLNVMERNGDVAYLSTSDVVFAYTNPDPLASGSLLCRNAPTRWCAFI